jgi:amino-acid N-acetyltransferase
MSIPSNEFVSWFRSASPYIHAHRGRTVVVAFGGELAEHGALVNLCHDLALLDALGLHLVVVYGARPQIDARLAKQGIAPRIENGVRITDARTLAAALESAGALHLEIEAKLSMGVANSPMAGERIRVGSGNFITARPYGVRNGIDFQFTGEVRRVDRQAIHTRLKQGEIVLIAPIGYSPTGEVFNLLSQQVAAEVAIAIGAHKLVFLTDGEGVRDRSGRLLRQLTADEADHLLAAKSEPAAELQCAIRACGMGVERSHLITWRTDGSMLLELFSRDGIGTMISSAPFDNIRTAGIDDIGGILALITPLEEEGVLVRRSREKLETEIDHFTIMERDGAIIGCAALYPLGSGDTGELACLVVHPDYRNGRIGAALLETLERRSESSGISRLVVLTSHTDHWFRERGFEPADIATLPEEKKSLYNYQRNSKVLVKQLRR